MNIIEKIKEKFDDINIEITEVDYGVGYPGYNCTAEITSSEIKTVGGVPGTVLCVSYPNVNGPTIRGNTQIVVAAEKAGMSAKDIFAQIKAYHEG